MKEVLISLSEFYCKSNLSTTWINNPSAPHSVDFSDGSTVRAILLKGSFGPRFACGFYCKGNCDLYLFSIFIVQTNSASYITSPSIGFPQVVWSANRARPVRINSTLQLTSDGDLILRDADGSIVWSTNTTGKSIAGLNLTDTGNLILFNTQNATVWQSFDHPTDSLVPGQKLEMGQTLSASISATNWSRGPIYCFVSNDSFTALVESNPPQAYYTFTAPVTKESKEPSYVQFLNGSLSMFINSSEPSEPYEFISVPAAASAQYMKLESTGHLKVYEWKNEWKEVANLLNGYLGECNYPLVCGENGICSNQQCTCPAATAVGVETPYFKQINSRQPDLGCSEITPLSCQESQYHSFVELKDMTYFTFSTNLGNTDAERCKQACLSNCSCKAAFFRYGSNSSDGNCYLPSEIFSLMINEKDKTMYNSTAYIKVQNAPTAAHSKEENRFAIILGASIGAFAGLFLLIVICVILFRKNRGFDKEEDYLDQVPGMTVRFSYEDLKTMTNNFSKKLGQGGFGSVYEGTLIDGTKFAVKRLEGLLQIKKSFLAEVETIGNIHHVNLVRLIGFCAEKSHRLLVYEYMSNGSLEKWIFHHKCDDFVLHWKQRKKIILDIAKGLTYLHEDCRQKIVHLDIKPQNILLDGNLNAKVSDFGLSKLIDRDQSQIMTTMRGTPGYLAPEWLSSIITEKVDVYSFGVVTLEILCGRKHFDLSQPEEGQHLLSLLKKNVEDEQLIDMVDKCSEDMQLHAVEVANMMKISSWCLQSDYSKRPSMSMVVKALEGVIDINSDLDCSFYCPPPEKTMAEGSSTALLASVLSGPR